MATERCQETEKEILNPNRRTRKEFVSISGGKIDLAFRRRKVAMIEEPQVR